MASTASHAKIVTAQQLSAQSDAQLVDESIRVLCKIKALDAVRSAVRIVLEDGETCLNIHLSLLPRRHLSLRVGRWYHFIGEYRIGGTLQLRIAQELPNTFSVARYRKCLAAAHMVS